METLNREWVQHCSWNCFLVKCWKGCGSVTGHLRELVLKALSVMTKPLISRNNQKAKLTFAEEHIVWRENCSKVHFSDESKVHLFGFGLETLFGFKLGKDWSPSAWSRQWKVEEEASLRDVFFSRSWDTYTDTWQVNTNVYCNLFQRHAVLSLQAKVLLQSFVLQWLPFSNFMTVSYKIKVGWNALDILSNMFVRTVAYS